MVQIDKDTNDLSYKIIGCAYKVHRELGPGLLESAYESCLCHELVKENIRFEKQKPLAINYDGVKLDCGYRIDILVNNKIIVELKAVEEIMPIHTAQILTYLKLSHKHLGLIINFNVLDLKNGIKRYIMK